MRFQFHKKLRKKSRYVFFFVLKKVSHWGNIHIQMFNKIKNLGADLKGEFGRVTYNSWTPDTGKNALKSLYAELPLHAWGAYYYDEIGNISTSSAYRDVIIQIIIFRKLKMQ